MSRVTCPSCGYANSEYRQTCKQCRAELGARAADAVQSCAHCGNENPAQASFCMSCGQALAAAERASAAAADSDSASSSKTGLWVMALIALIAIGFAFISGGSDGDDADTGFDVIEWRASTNSCSLELYQFETQPLMAELSRVVRALDIEDPESRADASIALFRLQTRIEDVDCAGTFPLKHETLEFTVVHLMDALRYANADEPVNMLASLNLARINLERFGDWSVDVGR